MTPDEIATVLKAVPLEPVELLTAEQRAEIAAKLGDRDPLPVDDAYRVMKAPLMGNDTPFFHRVLRLEAELDQARAERDQLRYERRLLGFARRILDLVAEGHNHDYAPAYIRNQAADVAQRIVDEIGHPVTDEDALGPSFRELIADLGAELAKVTGERDDAIQMLGDMAVRVLADLRPLAVRVLSWDWREQPDLAALSRAVTDLYGGHLAQADTGSDQYAIVLSTAPLDEQAATEAYREATMRDG